MGLIGACICLTLFIINVVMGSISGTPPLGNVAEMILLFVASIFFVMSILKREALANAAKGKRQN